MNIAAISTIVAVIALHSQPYAHAATVEASAGGWIDNVEVNFYAIDTSTAGGTYSFVNNTEQLRGLTSVDVGPPCVADPSCEGPLARQQANFTVLPVLPVVSDTLATGIGTARGSSRPTTAIRVSSQGAS